MAEKYTAEEKRMAEIAQREIARADKTKQEAIKKSSNALYDFLENVLKAVPAILKGVAKILRIWFG